MSATIALHPLDVRRRPVDRPTHATFVRRRLVVGMVLVALLALVVLSVRVVLADRGGVPASTPSVRPASQPALVAAPYAAPYVVQVGDSLWSIARQFHGSHSISSYVERLVDANHGATIQVGQTLALPS